MGCKTENKFINDVEYSTTQFPAIQGMQFKMELISLLGSSLPTVIELISKKDASKEEQLSIVSKAVTALFENAPPEKVVDIIVRVLTTGNTKRDGERLTKSSFDRVFAGDNMMEAYKAFIFVIQVNYSGFFKGQKGGNLMAEVQENQ